MQDTRRKTGVAKATLIETPAQLTEVFENMLSEFYKWVLNTQLDAGVNGLAQTNQFIYVPSSKNRLNGHGDIVATVGDYVIEMKDGRKTIAFTPEIKEAIARGDMSWAG